MLDWAASSYGDEWASRYDERFAYLTDTDAAVNALAGLAGDGGVLELGVGTGRLAIPLARRGFPVSGIDASAKMLKQLNAKPDGNLITAVNADFSEFSMVERFSLIYMSCNTLFDLPTQERQVSCISCAARHLTPSGKLLVEASTPDSLFSDSDIRVIAMEDRRVLLHTRMHDPIAQQVFRQRVTIDESGVRFGPIRNRYIWPSELDLMAQLANLSLLSRWGGWDSSSFGPGSSVHVSVYGMKSESYGHH